MIDHHYMGYEIRRFDVEDGQIIIQLQEGLTGALGPKITLTAIEDHGYPMIELEETSVR